MSSVTVDLGSLPGSADRFERAYERAVREMQRTLARAAAEERRTHAYRNRTGDLEASTTASDVITIGDTDEVQFGATMAYAKYVNDRGLMRVDELAAQAETELAYLFEGLVATI